MTAIQLKHSLPGGLYAITSNAATCHASPYNLLDAVHKIIDGGVTVIQYRSKILTDEKLKRQEARALLDLCRSLHVPLIINDDVMLAKTIHADGVHLGKYDASLAEARNILGSQAIIGASCYNKLELALNAEAAGADYVAFGSFFLSNTKPDAVKASPALLREARKKLSVPIVAIGGITPQNGNILIQAGANNLAVIEGVFKQNNPAAAAKQYAQLFACQQQSA